MLTLVITVEADNFDSAINKVTNSLINALQNKIIYLIIYHKYSSPFTNSYSCCLLIWVESTEKESISFPRNSQIDYYVNFELKIAILHILGQGKEYH